MRLLALAFLLLFTSCSYSENGGESWNKVQFTPTGSAFFGTSISSF